MARKNGSSKPVPQDLPAMEGPGVGILKDKKLDQLAGKLDTLREEKSKLAEDITQVEKSAHERMCELEIKQYRYGDRLMFINPGKDHVKTKAVKSDGVDEDDDPSDN